MVHEGEIPAPPILSVTSPLTIISAVTIKFSLASSSANCVLLIFICFLIVLFMAPVMPLLQFEPKPMAETINIDASFHFSGTGMTWGSGEDAKSVTKVTTTSDLVLRAEELELVSSAPGEGEMTFSDMVSERKRSDGAKTIEQQRERIR